MPRSPSTVASDNISHARASGLVSFNVTVPENDLKLPDMYGDTKLNTAAIHTQIYDQLAAQCVY